MSATITLANGLPASVIADFAAAVGSIPGCQLTALTLVTRDNRKDPRPIISADVTGWSPTLHRVTMDWQSVLPRDWPLTRIAGDLGGFVDLLTRTFASKMAIQRARAAAGVGIDTPFPLQSTYEHNLRLDHLHADRGALVLGLSAKQNPSQHPPMTLLVHPHLKEAHYSVDKYRGGPRLENRGNLAEEIHTVAGGEQETLRTIRVQGNLRGGIIMVGSFVTLYDHTLPDSMLGALAGRSVSDVADVHPAINHRRIIEAGRGMAYSRNTLWLDLEPDLVALAPYARTSRREAIVEDLLRGVPCS
jgi:hypothetical protein